MKLRDLLVLLLLALPAAGQDTAFDVDEIVPPAATKPYAGERSFESLSALQRSRRAKLATIDELRARLIETPVESEREAIERQIRALQDEVLRLDADFESIATGIDLDEFDLTEPDSFDLQAEVMKLVQPLIEELKDATEAPRQIERLRGQLEYIAGRERIAREALASIESLLDNLEPDDPFELRAALERSRDAWSARIKEAQGQATVTRFQLEKRLSQQRPFLETTQGALADFFRTRGLNLALALATAVLMFMLLRFLHRIVLKVMPGQKNSGRHIYARIADVAYFLFAGLFSLIAALLVLYASGDWVLLGLSILFLLGVAWAFKTAIPMFLEQIRLMLNLGTVREHERLVIDGIPYIVSKLSYYALISNPELAGGVRRLPIKDLTAMRSRTCSKDEIWFPSKRNSWVLLSDGVRGMVKHQSPDMVELQLLGGARATYQTSDYLELAPQNLSDGFRRTVIFGIDYEHQAIATTTVPDVFLSKIRGGLIALLGEDAIESLAVEFHQAGASSLDYQVLADLKGSAAPKFEAIGRLIQALCVDVCNERGWGIPFTQITVHQAQPALVT
ncbi:MAG: hypothetical protein WD226_02785 [Planctomycetota bacterium]